MARRRCRVDLAELSPRCRPCTAVLWVSTPVNSPKINGHGRLLMDQPKDEILAEESRPSSDKDYGKLGAGLLISLGFMVAGNLISVLIPQVHMLAWTILLAIFAKAAGLISDEFCDYANFWFQFMLRNLLPVLIAGIGVSYMDITILGKYFTFGAFFVVVMGIAGAVVGAMVFGRMFKLWPLEAAITAALCSCDVGGSGDIAILSASNRMQFVAVCLYSTRIGGALMILEISFLMPLFL